jgi:hypothetical protein
MNAPQNTSHATHKMPLKPPLPSLILLPLMALSPLLFQANCKPCIIAQLLQGLQLAVLAVHQRSKMGLLPAVVGKAVISVQKPHPEHSAKFPRFKLFQRSSQTSFSLRDNADFLRGAVAICCSATVAAAESISHAAEHACRAVIARRSGRGSRGCSW